MDSRYRPVKSLFFIVKDELMMIIGWGQTTRKTFGPTLAVSCPKCHTDSWLHLYRHRRWVSLFFIPVIPYSSIYLLQCPFCLESFKSTGDWVEYAKRLNALTKEYFDETISVADYSDEATKISLHLSHLLSGR